MTDGGHLRSPLLVRGALVQLTEGLIGVVPNIIPFQYNPQSLSRTLTPWNPFEVDQSGRGQLAPTAQPFDPEETISMTIELDAADRLGDGDPLAQVLGVADRIAAIEKLLMPTSGLLGDLAGAAADLAGVPQPPKRQTVSIVLLFWGAGRILPVRVSSYSIEETEFLPTLQPLMATISLELKVLTPDVFKCESSPVNELAIAAYRYFRLQQDALAVSHVARAAADALLPAWPF
ncbi:hypothetical protein [Paraliomyxa miuraensis]|uniref:hypothetical protein n=1 Tax=Paraliomyxa miuraensis TaxID=376150 RepID=UPI00225B3AD9|nr:hypothetical protein [Paraliomyxa miuraensis]MCX4245551.1 hypothetical protein [Paraliomyxa miuraensis]